MSLAALAQVLVSRPRLLLLFPLLAAILLTAATYLRRPLYSASVAFVPERLSSSGQPSSLAGGAGAFGMNVFTDVGRSSSFYLGVLDSRQLKERVLTERFADPRARNGAADDSVPLLTLLSVKGRTRAESLAAGIAELEGIVRTSVDPGSGILRVTARTHYPDLSAAIATRFVEALNHFNTSQRQSQASERRKFIDARIAVADAALHDAEESLRRFYQSNPGWSRSPLLAAEATRLRTGIDEARDVHTTLQREYELARIEEVSDTPVLTIVDPAVPPVRRSWPRRKQVFTTTLIVGILIGAVATLVADYTDRLRVQDPEAFTRLRRAFVPSFRWRR